MLNRKQESWKIRKDLEMYAGYIFQHKPNTLTPNVGSEGIKHFTIKTIIAYLLREQKKDFFDEVIVNKGKLPGRIDLLNISDSIVIECETELTEEVKASKREKYDNPYIVDFLFIDLKKVPDDLNEAYKYLKKKIINLDSD